MANFVTRAALLVALAAPTVFAQDADIKCSSGSPCPKDKPCCSQYGSCGVGAYCLGGCDPVSSFSLNACVPMPVCQPFDQDSFNNLDGFVKQDEYLGDPTDGAWVYSGEPVTSNGELWLTMADGTVGTLIKSTTAMWYGTFEASIRTSPGAGVVTAFIALGDSKDEIDFEFVGSQHLSAQTNFYSQGVTNYNNGKNITGQTDITADFHDYKIDWEPDTITWYIDGKEVRSLDRESTWNSTAGFYSYPQTPCQIQLSLWPAGLPSNGEGTIEWGGGLVDWNSPDMTNGYYHADFKNIKTTCAATPSGANVTGKTSYVFNDRSMTNQSVAITNNPTVLGSFQASGLDMDFGKSQEKNTTGSIPGQSGGGPSAAGPVDNGDGGSSTSDSGDGSSGTSPSGSASTGFVQGNGGMNNGASSTQIAPEQIMQGSLFAALVAIVGLCVL
ncbi:putative glycosidase crf2 [Cyphellophora attinorum]|uniref:Putative glycosidase crf2 n=1 Tax=Cyphellophora attinorum TaxID=1664694 RepID=A0A0N1H666_9EURO|nr:putative glycosidase crf2 [Phialophora attinorum]KPI37520.1 putative glycosidase crf2 [Phialophora attinorum]